MWIDIKEERPEIGQLCVVKDGCEIKINAVYLGYQITRAPLRNRHLFSAACITYDFPDLKGGGIYAIMRQMPSRKRRVLKTDTQW